MTSDACETPKIEISSCLKELFECSQEGILLLQASGGVLWHNAAIAGLLDLPEENREWNVHPVFSSLQWEGNNGGAPRPLSHFVEDLARTGGMRQGVCSPAGPGRENILLCSAQRLNSGPLAGLLLLRFTDLSMVRKVEESGRILAGLAADCQRQQAQLQESEECFRRLAREYQTLLDGIPDVLLHFSAERQVLWGNRAAVSRFGEETLFGMRCHAVLHGDDGDCQQCPLELCRTSGRPEVGRITAADGRCLEFRAFPIMGPEAVRADSFLLLQRDLTEQVSLQERTIQSNHLASLGELAAGVAHEINNPVTGIINCGQLLHDQLEGGADREVAQRIIREGERISGIVRSLLSLARIGHEKKEGVRIEEELNDLLYLTRAQMRKERIIVTIRLAPDLPAVTASPQQIRQVFLNIINNARYALNEKYPGFSEEKVLEIRGEGWEGGGGVRFTFLDFGPGIREAIRDRIFHPFFTTKPVGRGTGLGLSISNSIIADHGGRLLIDSVEGKYTKVIVELPVEGRGEEDEQTEDTGCR